MEYDKTAIPGRYNVARALPEETMALWLDALVRRVGVVWSALELFSQLRHLSSNIFQALGPFVECNTLCPWNLRCCNAFNQ